MGCSGRGSTGAGDLALRDPLLPPEHWRHIQHLRRALPMLCTPPGPCAAMPLLAPNLPIRRCRSASPVMKLRIFPNAAIASLVLDQSRGAAAAACFLQDQPPPRH